MLRSALALALLCSACASSPRVAPAAFRADAKIAVVGFHQQGADDESEASAAFRRDLTRCAQGTLLGDGDPDATIVITVDLVRYLQRGTKVQGADSAQVAVSGRVTAHDRSGRTVWSDEVSAFSPRFSTNGVYEQRLRAATATAMTDAASSLVDRLCHALSTH
jgi:hypothetical protein